jgi:hypothetical protein
MLLCVQPHSICGSELIDALAIMVQLGIIGGRGFADREELCEKLSRTVEASD